MRLKVDVTAGDIRRGQRRECDSCPIALATRRAFRKAKSRATVFAVYPFSIKFHSADGQPRVSAKVPKKATDFINNFDYEGRKAVKPFSFTLNVPKSILEAAK